MTNEKAIKWLKVEASYIEEDVGHGKEILEAYDMAIEALERDNSVLERVEDCISRESLRQKLQEHHDFFVNAYGGFSNLPQNNKSRVDEITNCIAMVVNEPPVTPQPKVGEWMHPYKSDIACECSECHIQMPITNYFNYCPSCGSYNGGD